MLFQMFWALQPMRAKGWRAWTTVATPLCTCLCILLVIMLVLLLLYYNVWWLVAVVWCLWAVKGVLGVNVKVLAQGPSPLSKALYTYQQLNL